MSEVWQLMPPDMFSLISVPFQGKSPSKVNILMSCDQMCFNTCSQKSICEVPSPYKEEIEKRKK